MKIKDWHTDERPREKLLKHGAENLSNTELLAIFLRTGTRDKNVITLAREMLNHFGSLQTLFNAPLNEFSEIPGIGIAKYAQFQAALELAKRTLLSQIQIQPVFNNSQLIRDFLRLNLLPLEEECFMGLLLDANHHLITHKILFTGTINHATIYPREIIKWALTHNATQMIIAHNHPQGSLTPSKEDLTLTQHLKNILQHVDVKLNDHFIIGKSGVYSFAEAGML